jgi:HD-GYP domain-containing protein (c-di-GMP phosphodiesterase class II)
MLRVKLDTARPGIELARSVYHPVQTQHILLKQGYELQASDLPRLNRFKVRTIWARCPGFDFLSKYANDAIQVAQQPVLNLISQTFDSLQDKAAPKLPYNDYCKSMGQLVESLMHSPSAALFMGDLADNDDDLKRHSTAVMYMSVLMGLKLSDHLVKQRRHINPVRAKEVNSLGVGALLHDVGVARLDKKVRQRYEATGDENDPKWQEHPSLGYETVHGNVEPSAATVVLHHHQRQDGSGYAGPDKPVLSGTRLHVFARISGLADQFDRLCHPPNQPEQPAVAALGQLMDSSWTLKFEDQVLRALCLVVPPFAPGCAVRLNDDRWAVIIDHNGSDPCHPLVQIIPGQPGQIDIGSIEPGDELNLAEAGLNVVEHDGRDVSNLNFEPPAVMAGTAADVAYL